MREGQRGACGASLGFLGVALALSLVAAACGEQTAEESPQAGIRAWIAAVQSGDAKGVWDRMSERSRAEALAVAGLAATTPEPWTKTIFAERLDVNWDNLDITVLPDATASRAEVEIKGVDALAGKRTAKMTMVLEAGTWRVELPTPPGMPAMVPVAPLTAAPATAAPASATAVPATAASTATATAAP